MKQFSEPSAPAGARTYSWNTSQALGDEPWSVDPGPPEPPSGFQRAVFWLSAIVLLIVPWWAGVDRLTGIGALVKRAFVWVVGG